MNVSRQVFRAGPGQVQWGYFDATLTPIGEVASGEVFTVASVSGLTWEPERDRYLAEAAKSIFEQERQRGPGPHVVTGPILVQGALPGQVLEVEILELRLPSPFGYNVIDPIHGLVRRRVESPERAIIPIDQERGEAEILPGVKVTCRPFFGIIGVAPPPGWGRLGSREPRAFGGNLDNKELTAGARLFLPIFVPGALLGVGDGHGLQGDGEVDMSALETSMEGDLRAVVHPGLSLELPVAVTSTHFITMAFSEVLDEATTAAVEQMIGHLERHCGLSWKQAYRLCSLCGDLRVTQVVNDQKGVHCMLPVGVIRQLGGRLPYLG